MSDWTPWDPHGSRPPGPPGGQGPDPEPIVRAVRIGFLFAGLLGAAMAASGLFRFAGADPRVAPSLIVTGVTAAVVLAVLGAAAWSLRPERLIRAGKRHVEQPRNRRDLLPRAERARAMGLRGLAMTWANRAMLYGFVPVLAGLTLAVLHARSWELLAFTGAALVAGLFFQHQVTGAVRRAVDDPDLLARYGSQ